MARQRVVVLTIAEVEHIGVVLARKWMGDWEPIPEFKTRFPNKLESCLVTPFMYFNQKPLYPRLIDKAAILFYLMIKNHPFTNGNKRIAMTSLFTFLDSNGKWLKVPAKSLYQVAVWVAKSQANQKDIVVGALTNFISKHLIAVKELQTH